jgi:hypothetical protein
MDDGNIEDIALFFGGGFDGFQFLPAGVVAREVFFRGGEVGIELGRLGGVGAVKIR